MEKKETTELAKRPKMTPELKKKMDKIVQAMVDNLNRNTKKNKGKEALKK